MKTLRVSTDYQQKERQQELARKRAAGFTPGPAERKARERDRDKGKGKGKGKKRSRKDSTSSSSSSSSDRTPKKKKKKRVKISTKALKELKEKSSILDKVMGFLGEKKETPSVDELQKGDTRCRPCKQDFTSEKGLRRHIRKFHAVKTKHKCTEPGCNKVFVTRKQMEAHTLLHDSGSEVEKQKFHCNMGDCDNVGFTTKQAFEKHVRELHPMKQYRYKCHFCPKQFDVDRYRKTHEKKCPHNPQKQQFKCFYCEKLFSDKNNRNKHMKHVHRHGQL